MKTIYEKITNEIIKQVEAIDEVNWKKPWFTMNNPRNIISDKAYRGINCVLLSENQYWGTFKQWQEKGCFVKKGEKSKFATFWKFFNNEEDKEDSEKMKGKAITDIKNKSGRPPLVKYYNVFSMDQVNGEFAEELKEKMQAKLNNNKCSAKAESFINNYLASQDISVIKHDVASYSPSLDRIKMPDIGQFEDSSYYYSTFLHEIAHSSGHKNRLNRNLCYAKEELVAELSSTMLCGIMGIEQKPRPDHAHYIKSWLSLLKNDRKLIINMASQAQKACDYIQENAVEDNIKLAA